MTLSLNSETSHLDDLQTEQEVIEIPSQNPVTDDLIKFYLELNNNIINVAKEASIESTEAFFDEMTSRLESCGELETADRAYLNHQIKNRSIRIDGSGGDPRDSDGVLSVIICDFHEDPEPRSINSADAKKLFVSLNNFLTFCRKSDYLDVLTEIKSSAAGLADLIDSTWPIISKIKLILITNSIYKSRTDSVAAGTIDGIPVTYNIWDLSRFYRYETSNQARENLEILFKDEYGASVPALLAANSQNELETYLMVIPGNQLADIYDKWGARLLESNVRSFLQARGKVNQGIRDTIKNEPAMFFSYNNGLSATADSVESELTSEGLKIISAKNLQIVNGGQTTATVHAARNTFPEQLADVFIQMKLTVVPSVSADIVVPKISEYANSQNKVSVSDFFSNHPFHVRIEEFSRRIFAPATSGSNRETKWFYERARGQYLVERAKRSDAERRKFEMEFPKAQLFTKTDLAKVQLSFDCKPDTVSKGAQKNFGYFSKEMGNIWVKNDYKFDQTWYKRLISKLIIFRHLEKLIPKQEWYPGGYRANIITYAIAKLAEDAEAEHEVIDLDLIWREQIVNENLEKCLLVAAEAAMKIIMQPIQGMRNITEWAKKQACWEQLRVTKVNYPSSFKHSMIKPEEANAVAKENRKEAIAISGIEAQSKVIYEGKDYWERLRIWSINKNLISFKEDGILKACTFIPRKVPSERQCISAISILERARDEGYNDGNDAPKIKIAAWERPH